MLLLSCSGSLSCTRLGEASGIRRFLSAETARSLQTSHGRFIRLGLAATVATAGTAVMAKSAMSTGAGAAALADAAVIGSSTALSLRSAFRQLAVDAVRTPNRAQETLRLARHAAERTGLTQTLKLDSNCSSWMRAWGTVRWNVSLL